MTTTVTLLPLLVSGVGSWQGAVTPEAAVADSDDTTWVAFTRSSPITFQFGPIPGAPGPTVVTSVTVKLRHVALDDIVRDYFLGRLITSPTLLAAGEGRHVVNLTATASEEFPVDAGTAANFDSAATWTPLTVDTCSNLAVRVWADGGAADSIGIANASLEVVYDTAGTPAAPTVTMTAPTGVLPLESSPPVVTWSSSTSQRAWQVRVFSAAQYGAGGFDPGVDDATWETGPHGGELGGVVVAAVLDETVAWRAYVRSYDGYQWSAWAYTGWSYATAPTVTVTAPSSASGHDFDVAWAFTAGASGARQVAAEVRVFDATPGDVDDDAQYTSGVLWQSAPFHTVPAWIEDTDTNEVWVRAMDADGQWSDWDDAALTLTPSATSTPAGATATWNAANGRVVLVLPACDNAGTAEIRRSIDAGVTWAALDPVATSDSVTTTTYDYRAPLNASARYDWRQLDATTDGAGAWTTIATVAVPAGVSWVKHPTVPARNVQVRVLAAAQQSDSDAASVLAPDGRDLPIVQADTRRGGDEVSVEFHVTSWAQAMAVDALFRSRVPVLVQRADGRQWWLTVKQQGTRAVTGLGVDWAVAWQGTEVGEP